MSKPYLKVEGLSFRRDHRILDDISWKVRDGEQWVILGANGSGKTTLLKILTGYEPPTQGSVTIGKEDLLWEELRQRVGFVSTGVSQFIEDQETALAVVISGKYGMINYWGPVKRDDRKRAKSCLKKVECLDLYNRPWGFLSQGERQRVLIGRAMMTKMRVLFLDEPCAGLDPLSRELFLDFLGRLASRKRPPIIVMVTHHVEEITGLFTHALILKNGKVLRSGKLDEVLKSKAISSAFDSTIRLRCSKGRYRLSFPEEE